MKIQLMNVQRQHEEYAKEYEEAALSVLRSGRYIGGPEVDAFEKEFAEYQGAKYGISCGNGTDAIILALRALGIGKGDEVITVAWTFFATAESIAAVGAVPVFVDVDPVTYCMDPKLAEAAITRKTKALLPVNFYGNCADLEKIQVIAQKYNLKIIADCAQSTGSRYKGERKKTLGDVSCFSFFPTKNLGASGDGGMILTDDEHIAQVCKALKIHGAGKNGLYSLKYQYELEKKNFPSNIPVGETKYYNYLIGYNSRLDAIQAAILRKKLRHIETFINRRRDNAQFYNEALKNTTYITPMEDKDTYHSYYIYALKHPKANIIKERLNHAGIDCGTYYPIPLHLQGAFKELGYKEGDLPVTEELAKTTFAIPIFPELETEEREYISNMLMSIERNL
ncbi:DegT/DnrJ/EryC1/StrS family aminotransferase [bacterium D16-54]|nr:DegT/DnrJ/EryC1/StrS family aminotransferase [bacterium D16-54]RKJ15212.1 DegT/DnrJ/EryC1/StrS family aminotransferase [bacterium D16-56]